MKTINKPYGIIYLITNLINGKKYIGKTTKTMEYRWKKGHIKLSEKDKPKQTICKAIKKYGVENFKTEQILECESKEILSIMETFKIMVNHSYSSEGGYNETWGGDGGCLGYKHTQETLKLLSDQKKGVPQSEEHKRNLSIVRKGKSTGPFTIERCQNISKTLTGKVQSETHRKHNGESHSKTYMVTKPNNEIIIIKNLTEFCKINNLRQGNMVNVTRGERKHHKGYKCELYTGK